MNHESIFFISRPDDFFDGQRSQDEARHRRKLDEAIRDNLPTIIGDGSIIFEDPDTQHIVRIPMKAVELPDFRFGDNNEGVGAGEGEVGQVIGATPGPGGEGAGSGAGVEYYDEYYSAQEIKEMVYSQMGLPNLQRKKRQAIQSKEVTFDDFRKKRTIADVDIMRTIRENIKRNAKERGVSEIGDLSLDDIYVRTWREKVQEEKAALNVLITDISGSMGDRDSFENYVKKIMCWWTLDFLETKYRKVENLLIVHEERAYVLENKADFFQRGASGGTYCSSGTKLTLKEIKEHYPPDQCNIYCEHYSDGDNYEDNSIYVQSIQDLLDIGINQFAFIQTGRSSESGVLAACRRGITDPRFKGVIVAANGDIWPGLQTIFPPEP